MDEPANRERTSGPNLVPGLDPPQPARRRLASDGQRLLRIALLAGLAPRAFEPSSIIAAPGDDNVGSRTAALRGCLATYNAPPRAVDGHVDLPRLLGELADLGANTYNWLVWHQNPKTSAAKYAVIHRAFTPIPTP